MNRNEIIQQLRAKAQAVITELDELEVIVRQAAENSYVTFRHEGPGLEALEREILTWQQKLRAFAR